MRLIHQILYSTLLLLFLTPMQAQEGKPVSIGRLNNENSSLRQNAIHSIYQDKYGFLWVGNQEGIERYDGIDFSPIGEEREKKNVGRVEAITGDKDNIWFGSQNGLFKISLDDFSLTSKENLEATSHIDHIKSLLLDNDALWIGTSKSIYKYDCKEESLKKIADNHKIGDVINTLGDFVFFGGKDGLYYCGKNDTILKSLNITTRVWSMSKSTNKEKPLLLFGTEKGIKKIKINVDNIPYIYSEGSKISIQNNDSYTPHTMLFDDQNRLWIGTRSKGLYMLDTIECEQIATPIEGNRETNEVLDDTKINTLYQTKEGIIWIGTNRDGLNFYDDSFKKTFTHHLRKSANNSENNVWALFQYNNGYDECDNESDEIWVGVDHKGLIRYNIETNTIINIYPPSKDSAYVYSNIYAIEQFSTDKLFLGTNNGIRIFNLRKEKPYYPQDQDTLLNFFESKYIISLYFDEGIEDNEDIKRLWIGTIDHGLFISELIDKKFTLPKPICKDCYEYHPRVVFIKAVGKDIWVGTEQGLQKYDRKLEQKLPIKSKNYSFKKDIKNDYISSIWADKTLTDSTIYWVSRRSVGLSKFVCKGDSLVSHKTFTQKDGLNDLDIYGILSRDKQLWLSTNSGIFSLDKETEEFRLYQAIDGIQNREFNAGAFFKNKVSNTLFFGGLNGFSSLNKKSLDTLKNYKISLFSYKNLNDNYEDLKDVSDYFMSSGKQHLGLTHLSSLGDTIDTIHYLSSKKGTNGVFLMSENLRKTASSFSAIDNIRIVSKKKGLFISEKEKNGVTLFPLSFQRKKSQIIPFLLEIPNEVDISIAYNNGAGIKKIKYNKEYQIIEETILIFMFAGLMPFGLIFAFFIQKEFLENGQTERRLKMQLQFKNLSHVMRSHFTNNSIMDLHSFIYRDDVSKMDAELFFSQFEYLYEKANEFVRDSEEGIKLQEEIEFLQHYVDFEKQRRAFDFQYILENKVQNTSIRIPALMIQTLIENALQHGFSEETDNHISVCFEEVEGKLRCCIEDNGKGRAAQKNTPMGQGLQLIRDRIEILGELHKMQLKFEITDLMNPTGTIVIFELPIIKTN